ncbi:hypothetical protein KDA_40690 [Dictyobacter alpinus]|uniref:Uncharacterized protein n=1 Tax=Dictyobacter alpinus TaxID=2014873 RepID=A0A402BB60_9CHLR|nr:hypothetical protein [Dictyobacter alpinus]GCE28585.1 hypothetical protein KDA_40690 [Dictyobacter alpinus]
MEINPNNYDRQTTRIGKPPAGQKVRPPQKMPKAQALEMANKLKHWFAVSSILGFGAFGGLVALHQVGSTTSTATTSTQATTSTSSQTSKSISQPQEGNNIGTTTATPTATATSTPTPTPVDSGTTNNFPAPAGPVSGTSAS